MTQAKPLPATATLHPLEPLTAREVEAAIEIVKADARRTDACRFVGVTLHEPTKDVVLNNHTGIDVPREAFVILLDNAERRCIEVVVSLGESRVSSWRAQQGVQPAIMLDEFVDCENAVNQSPQFIEALRKRGVDDVGLVMVDPWSFGSYGVESEDDKGKRLSRALAWVRSEPADNGYARPLEGVVAIVDLNKMEVLRVEDYGVVPLPPDPGNWTRRCGNTPTGAPRRSRCAGPDGSSFPLSPLSATTNTPFTGISTRMDRSSSRYARGARADDRYHVGARWSSIHDEGPAWESGLHRSQSGTIASSASVVTTVGCDLAPVSGTGRFLGVLLMLYGVAMFVYFVSHGVAFLRGGSR